MTPDPSTPGEGMNEAPKQDQPEGPWTIWVCPECGDQNTRDRGWLGDAPTYCLNHEDESGRTERPEHRAVQVSTLPEQGELEPLHDAAQLIADAARLVPRTQVETMMNQALAKLDGWLSQASQEGRDE